jgi:apolipoprotein N-acyltransferase
MLFSGLGAAGGQRFRIGFVAGLVHFLISLYWLLYIPFRWHGLPIGPAFGWLMLGAYCALYPAFWVWLCWKLFPEKAGLEQFLSATLLRRVLWALAAGAIWTALEFARGAVMTGFPWNFVGASQYRWVPLIQIASLTGIYGVSFLVVWSSVSLCGAALSLARRNAARSLWAMAGLPLLVVAGVAGYGLSKLTTVLTPGNELTVAMIQPSIPQTLIWDPAGDATRFQTVLDLTDRALVSKPRVLLWPESAVPDLTPEIQQTIGQLARNHNVWLVFCAGTLEGAQYYNSALLCNPEGGLDAIYNKRRLVAFGEYIPLVHWFPFFKWLTSVGVDQTAGIRPVDFDIQNPSAKMSVLICFEDTFPQEARAHVGPDTDFLINLSNDGWFGHGAEQWQQADCAAFRAVENGVPLLRCTNDGLTCWIDAQGRFRQIFKDGGGVYGPGYLIAQIPLRRPGDRSRTIYNQYGDWFPIACSAIGIGCLLGGIWRGNRSKLPEARRDTVQN